MKHRFNTEHLVNIHRYHTDLAKQIDEAEWIGNFDHADFLRDEYDRVTEMRDKGAVYWPMHEYIAYLLFLGIPNVLYA